MTDSAFDTRPFIAEYLRSRPPFFTLIRSQEAALFQRTSSLLQHPILDLGAGDGFFARLVFGRGGIDIGLDIEGSRLGEAEDSGAFHEVLTYNGVHIPFPDATFGSVVSNCVLEHVVDLKAVVVEVHRVLKPAGVFLTTVMTDRWEDYMLGARIVGDRYRVFMRKRQEHRNLLSLAQWEARFTVAGFVIDGIVGYLSPRTSAYLDAMHYVSVPSLVTRRLTGRWVAAPDLWASLAPLLEKAIDLPVEPAQSAALFFILRKPA